MRGQHSVFSLSIAIRDKWGFWGLEMKRFYLVLLFALSTCAAKGNQLSHKNDFDASSEIGLVVIGVALDYQGQMNEFHKPPVLNWRQFDFETGEAGKKAIKVSDSNQHFSKKLRKEYRPVEELYLPYYIFELVPGDYFLESFNNEYFIPQMAGTYRNTKMRYERSPVITVKAGQITYAGELRSVLAEQHFRRSHIGSYSELKFVEPDLAAANAYLAKMTNVSGSAILQNPRYMSFDCGRKPIDSRGTCKSKQIVITSPPALE